MNVEIKDLLFLIVGMILGLLFGIAIYWFPLRQFKNELVALWNLSRIRYKQGDKIKVKAGVDLKPLNPNDKLATTGSNIQQMLIWNDEGISWHHTGNGWIRARVIHVARQTEELSPVYKICHLDIVK